ncbi:unnamed protein product [Adineta ricciae]|uniref:Uncharacterized protein n=1 Tax=Adineta ricciae TaxID=249248 RepID=A0A815G2V7_ADIRI|nr:unnamed protein product [Adineta ricciae]CAF1652171.1 unnamed protein product [Adineta ricciae]
MLNTNATTQYGNSLLYMLPPGELSIQPYWIFGIQMLIIQIIQRTWNYCKHKTFFTGLEEYFLDDNRHRMDIDILDFLLLLPQFAHFIWYCFQQPKCMSYPSATIWKCYNIFGYKMANFIIPQCWNSFTNVIPKLFDSPSTSSWEKYLKGPVITMNSILVVVSLAYIFTNIIPMCGAYVWIFIIYLIFVGVLGGIILSFPESRREEMTHPLRYHQDHQSKTERFLHGFIYTIIFVLGFYIAPTMYNYSQYLYFGDTYLHSIVAEYRSRNTELYLEDLKVTEAIGHLTLSPLIDLILIPIFACLRGKI